MRARETVPDAWSMPFGVLMRERAFTADEAKKSMCPAKGSKLAVRSIC